MRSSRAVPAPGRIHFARMVPWCGVTVPTVALWSIVRVRCVSTMLPARGCVDCRVPLGAIYALSASYVCRLCDFD